jgi:hypothetical protein
LNFEEAKIEIGNARLLLSGIADSKMETRIGIHVVVDILKENQ